jgi:hypothetical protein
VSQLDSAHRAPQDPAAKRAVPFETHVPPAATKTRPPNTQGDQGSSAPKRPGGSGPSLFGRLRGKTTKPKAL